MYARRYSGTSPLPIQAVQDDAASGQILEAYAGLAESGIFS